MSQSETSTAKSDALKMSPRRGAQPSRCSCSRTRASAAKMIQKRTSAIILESSPTRPANRDREGHNYLATHALLRS